MQKIIRETAHIGHDTKEQISPPSAFPALYTRGLNLAGLSDAGHGYRMHRPQPQFGHLLVTLGGAGRVLVDDKWLECGEGYAYVSPPNAPSAFETQAGPRWQFAWIFLDAMGNSRIGLLAGERSCLVPADAKPLATAIEGLYREGVGRADGTLLNQWAHLIDAYCRRITQPSPAHEKEQPDQRHFNPRQRVPGGRRRAERRDRERNQHTGKILRFHDSFISHRFVFFSRAARARRPASPFAIPAPRVQVTVLLALGFAARAEVVRFFDTRCRDLGPASGPWSVSH